MELGTSRIAFGKLVTREGRSPLSMRFNPAVFVLLSSGYYSHTRVVSALAADMMYIFVAYNN